MPFTPVIALNTEASIHGVPFNLSLMLNQKGQWLKIFTVVFSVIVCLGLMVPAAFAGGGWITTGSHKPFIMPTTGKLIQGYHAGHYAFDIADSSQPRVRAAGSGTVIKIVNDCETVSNGCGGGYGNNVIIDHGDGFSTMYAHLATVAVEAGDAVTKGAVIGQMGRTGNVKSWQGIHLHFEVRENGIKKRPSDYMGK
jgi:murein DD-endopeptidase MepM/ murein hydrolase activator NlpD